MSSSLHSLTELPRLTKLSDDMVDLTLPPLASWSYSYRLQEPFSSPPRSSSPPRTPYNTKHAYDYAHIKSSPQVGMGADFNVANDHCENQHTFWHQLPAPRLHLKTQPHHSTSLVSRSTLIYRQRYSAASEFDMSEYSESAETDFDDVRTDLPTRTPLRSATPLSDSADEEQDDGTGFSFSDLGIRTMCFRTSAERGRWKTDPMSPQHTLLLSTRKSAPANESVTDVLTASRPISEPAPSIPSSITSSHPVETDKQCESEVPEVTSAPSPATLPSLPTSPALESMEPLPPLTSDRDSSMDVDEILTPSSPLPPSSPPPFSPAISLAPLRTQSTTSGDSNPSSPLIAPSSPLSPISSEIGEEDALDLILMEQGVVATGIERRLDQNGVSTTSVSVCSCIMYFSPAIANGFSRCQNLDLTPTPYDRSTCAPSQSGIIESDLPQSGAHMTQSSMEPPPSTPPKMPEGICENSSLRCILTTAAHKDVPGSPREHSTQLPTSPKVLSSRRSSTSSETKPSSSPAASAENSATATKRPKSEQDSKLDDGSSRKRVKTSDGPSQIAVASTSTEPHKGKPKAAVNKRRKNPVTSEVLTPTSKKRRSKYVADSDSESSASSSRASSVAPPRLTFTDGVTRDQNGIAEEDAEICGMIIEGMATSRASSLPISQIYKIVTQSRPSMKAERSEQEWHVVFDRVLQSGVAGRGSGVFGKVDSSYKVYLQLRTPAVGLSLIIV